MNNDIFIKYYMFIVNKIMSTLKYPILNQVLQIIQLFDAAQLATAVWADDKKFTKNTKKYANDYFSSF